MVGANKIWKDSPGKIEYLGNISNYSRVYKENISNYSIKSKKYPDSNLISKKKTVYKLNQNKIGRDSGGENCNFSKIILGVPEKKPFKTINALFFLPNNARNAICPKKASQMSQIMSFLKQMASDSIIKCTFW